MRKGSIEKIHIQNEVIDNVKKELRRTHVNGDVIIECFHIHNEQVLNIPSYIEEDKGYFENILASEDIKAAIPQLYKGDQRYVPVKFSRFCGFTLDGEIARSIYYGGAYYSYNGTPREAKNLAGKLCDVMFGDGLFDIEVYKADRGWCRWFYDVVWDDTWFIVERKLNRLWLICITDTD